MFTTINANQNNHPTVFEDHSQAERLNQASNHYRVLLAPRTVNQTASFIIPVHLKQNK